MKEVHCIKLDTKLEGLERAPYPGDHENNLNLFDESSQSYLKEQMENYFFSEHDIDQIKGYVPK
jgi:Fe-S cluster biosynthesis and repair protein YggX